MTRVKRPRHLKVKEFNDILVNLRKFAPLNCREWIGLIVGHVDSLEEKYLALERENRELRQTTMLENMKELAAAHERVEPAVHVPPKVYTSRGERLWHLFQEPEKFEAYQSVTSQYDVDQMKLEANEWAAKNGRNLIE